MEESIIKYRNAVSTIKQAILQRRNGKEDEV